MYDWKYTVIRYQLYVETYMIPLLVTSMIYQVPNDFTLT